MPLSDVPVVLRDLYQATFLSHRGDKKNPFSSVEYLEQEESTADLLIMKIAEVYQTNNIHSLLGISFKDFIAYPREIIETMVITAKALEKIRRDAMANLNNLANGLK